MLNCKWLEWLYQPATYQMISREQVVNILIFIIIYIIMNFVKLLHKVIKLYSKSTTLNVDWFLLLFSNTSVWISFFFTLKDFDLIGKMYKKCTRLKKCTKNVQFCRLPQKMYVHWKNVRSGNTALDFRDLLNESSKSIS